MARCETCNGSGIVSAPYIPSLGLWSNSPCPACGGTGVQSCCDGPVGGPHETPSDPNGGKTDDR